MDKSTDDLIQEFVADGGDFRDWRPSYNIAPTDRVPVVRSRERGGEIMRTVDGATWGLRPMWVGEKAPAPINARLESVATNGLFRHAFLSNRLIVPMNGYYEWEATANGKQPHFIQNNSLLAAAGLYEPRKQPDGSWSLTMTIITREAKDASGEIHDRMPVFLTPDTYDDWLLPGKADKEDLLAMLDHASLAMASTMHTYPVSKRVNSVRDEEAKHDPALIEPL
jgi:putative SOS response-associated peptidase YedK